MRFFLHFDLILHKELDSLASAYFHPKIHNTKITSALTFFSPVWLLYTSFVFRTFMTRAFTTAVLVGMENFPYHQLGRKYSVFSHSLRCSVIFFFWSKSSIMFKRLGLFNSYYIIFYQKYCHFKLYFPNCYGFWKFLKLFILLICFSFENSLYYHASFFHVVHFCKKPFSFIKLYLSIVSLNACTTGALFWKTFLCLWVDMCFLLSFLSSSGSQVFC